MQMKNIYELKPDFIAVSKNMDFLNFSAFSNFYNVFFEVQIHKNKYFIKVVVVKLQKTTQMYTNFQNES